jgi:hypothetical protein
MTPHERNLMKQFNTPTPHKDATHAYLLVPKEANRGKVGKATVGLKDFSSLVGTSGKVQYGRYARDGWIKLGKSFRWDGEKAI